MMWKYHYAEADDPAGRNIAVEEVPCDEAIEPETCLQGPANAPETLPPHLAALGSAANAQDVEEWKLRGAYDDTIRIPAVGWDFRTPDGFIEGMTVFSRGEFRPDVGHLYFPRPFTNDLSFLPQGQWGQLLNGGESKLWYAATPSNSLLVTWVNGLLDRNPLAPTNFQAEFFPDGSYEYRYGDHSELHPFVLPFDLDGDGLENTVDPAPMSAGLDAHQLDHRRPAAARVVRSSSSADVASPCAKNEIYPRCRQTMNVMNRGCFSLPRKISPIREYPD